MPVAILAILAVVAAAIAQLGSIVAHPPVIDLGFIEPRSTITRSFQLVNPGPTPVTIASATPTCTCTTVEAAGKIVPPRGFLELPLTMKVAASTGVKVAAVTFTFVGGPPPVTVEMKGEIAYPVRATAIDFTNGATVPYINAFGDPTLPQGAAAPPLTGELTVTAIDGHPFRIESVMGKAPVFVGADPASTSPQTSYKVRYSFEGLACEHVPPFLVIATDHPKAPVIDLRVRHKCTKIAPQLPFAEYRANLGVLAPGVPTPFEFEFKKSSGWKVTAVQSRDPRVVVELLDQRSDADHAMISLAATAAVTARGIVLVPISMTATDPSGATRSSDFWVYFDAVAGAAAPPPSQNAGS